MKFKVLKQRDKKAPKRLHKKKLQRSSQAQHNQSQPMKEQTTELLTTRRKIRNNCIACKGKGIASNGFVCVPCSGNGVGLPEIDEIFFTKIIDSIGKSSEAPWYCIAVRPGIGDKALVKGRFCSETKIFKRSQVQFILREW